MNGDKEVPVLIVAEQRLPRPYCLLALDGAYLTPEMLSAAEEQCLRLTNRVDILLVNSPKAPTSLLHRLLIRLEDAGIHYRLTSVTGDLTEQMTRHLRRFLGITLVMVTALPVLGTDWNVKVADLRYRGFSLTTLASPGDPGRLFSNTY
jgi:hypothetical protein